MSNTVSYESRRRDFGKVISFSRGYQLVLWMVGLALLGWACFDPQLRDSEGFLKPSFCLRVSVGVGFVVLGSAIAGAFRSFAFWFVLALISQAISLQLIDAGPLIRYQHYKLLGRILAESHPLIPAFLVAQTVFVAVGFRRRWTEVRGWIRKRFKVWQVVGVALVFLLPCAAFSREAAVYLKEFGFASYIQLLTLANVVLMAAAFPPESLGWLKQRLDRVFGSALNNGPGGRLDRFAVVGALWVALVAGALSFFLYERHPHVPDEVIYLYQARYLAEGHLSTPAAPVPDAFSIYMIPYRSERWYSPFPPGWPALLALGILMKLPWLINPLLAGINVLLAYLFLRELYPLRTARWALLLLCVSPWYLFMAMNFMSHTLTLTCALGAALAMARARRGGRMWFGLLSGLAVGALSLIRPMDCLVVGSLLALWAVGVGGRRLKRSSLVAFVIGATALGIASLAYNKLLTGSAGLSPLMDYYENYFGPRTNAIGFGPERGLGWASDAFPGHSPFEAVINAGLNAFSVNIELLGWGTGSLLIVALAFAATRDESRRSDFLMLSVIGLVVALHSLYWFNGGPDFGARYWFLMIVPLAALGARGLQSLERTLDASRSGSLRGAAAVAAVLALCCCSLANYFPWRAIDKYHHYLRMRPDIRDLAIEHDFGKSLVLIKGQSHPDYQSAWTYNPLSYDADAPIYAWDKNPETRARVLEAYEGRPVWIVDGPTLTHGPYRVIAGPLPSSEVGAGRDD